MEPRALFFLNSNKLTSRGSCVPSPKSIITAVCSRTGGKSCAEHDRIVFLSVPNTRQGGSGLEFT